MVPGSGFCTVTVTLPTCEASAVPVPANSPAETNVVGRAVVPNMIFAPLTNLLPETTSVKEPNPIVVGLIAVTTGIGLSRVTVLLPWTAVFA